MSPDGKPAPKPPLTSFGWGYNNYAGLGLGHTARVLSPTPVRLPEKTIDVQGGTDFSVALTKSGAVFAWGGNRWGQLGDGTIQQRFAWTQVKLPTRSAIVAISAGDDHVLALSRSGQVFAWGRNDVGQVGAGSLSDRQARPVAVPMPGKGRITGLAAGSSCSFGLTSTGAVYGWGHAIPLGAAVSRDITNLLITEKGMTLKEAQNTLVFEVDLKATKTEVKQAVETLFKVKVTGVRTATVEGKERRRGKFAGYRPDWKKAYVRLKDGEKMPEYLNSL